MIFAVLLGVAVVRGTECEDAGIPPPFGAFFTCNDVCDDPMLVLAASMFCNKSCGLCPAPEPDPQPTAEPTEESVGFVKSHAACSRQEIQNEMEQAIYRMISAGDYSATTPCLRMRTHLADILTADDELVGTPDVLLICGCLEFFDEDFSQEHLNCRIADEHMYDLRNECIEVGGYKSATCDLIKIENELISMFPAESTVCADFAAGVADYGTEDFDPTAICDCVYSFEPVFAGKTFNCMFGGSHLMNLYTDICPAYENPCDRAAIETEMVNEIVSKGKVEEYGAACLAMDAHFDAVLDPATDMIKEGAYGDFALICQCLAAFPRKFVDENLRCGLAGHDAFSIWEQCATQTPACEDMSCALCEASLRCSMNIDGTCKTSCPVDGGCFDDPSNDYTCEDLENIGAAPLQS